MERRELSSVTLAFCLYVKLPEAVVKHLVAAKSSACYRGALFFLCLTNRMDMYLYPLLIMLANGGSTQAHMGTTSGGSQSDLPWSVKKKNCRIKG